MWKLLNVIAAFVVPPRTLSRLYLTERLAHYGVDVKRLPEACLQELADDIMETIRGSAAFSHKNWREIATHHVDGAAVNIVRQLLGEDPLDSSAMFAEYLDHFDAIMRKHGVSVPL